MRPAFLALLLALAAAPAAAQPQPDAGQAAGLAELAALDRRVAAIGFRLATANRGLCADPTHLSGLDLHHLSQYGRDYRAAARARFGLGALPAVLLVVEGGPADLAGVAAGDQLVGADDARFEASEPGPGADGSFARTAAATRLLETALADGRARLRLTRRGRPLTVEIEGRPGCRSTFQVVPGRRLNAYADGTIVQITSRLAQYAASDDELAAVLAHEFAHNVLRHRERLDRAGVARGALSQFGRSARLIRETEIEADRLSVRLMAAAGFRPAAAAAFWRRFGPRDWLGLFGGSTHQSWRRRVELIEQAIAELPQ